MSSVERSFKVLSHSIDDGPKCFTISEIGNNHQGDLDLAIKMVDAAKAAGADCAKFQKRNNRVLSTSEMYHRPYDSENSFADTYGAHREVVELDMAQFHDLKQYCDEVGVIFSATPFEEASADDLESIDTPLYKIASADLNNTPLLRHVAGFGKPIIISTGYATIEDVDRAVEVLGPVCENFAILQCTASYPCDTQFLNLRVIETLRNRYPDRVVGYSGHDAGTALPLVAYMLGARIIEKHMTLSRTMKGTDHVFSLTPDAMRRMVRDIERVPSALGDGVKQLYDVEVPPMRKMQKRLVAARQLEADTVLSRADLIVRVPADNGPGTLPPYAIDSVVGSRLTRSLAPEEPLREGDVSGRT
ncbi:MAG: N-acetylneuraminate synthase family protein [Neomegalonema sp.]